MAGLDPKVTSEMYDLLENINKEAYMESNVGKIFIMQQKGGEV